jgi:3-oxoacyl-(acyl-carrier-protein) synthase
MGTERVVITGWGAVSPFGIGGAALWEGVSAGRVAIAPLPSPRSSLRPGFGGIAPAEAKDLRALPNSRDMRPGTMTRYTWLSTFALGTAMAHGQVPWDDGDGALRRGCYIASYTNSDRFDKYVQLAFFVTRPGEDGQPALVDGRVPDAIKKFTGFEFLKLMNNMPAAHAAIEARCQGPANTFLGTPSGGIQAIGRAVEVIRDDLADTMYAGGTGSAVHEQMMMTRAVKRLFVDSQADPARACRPFDRGATGVVPGEGGGILVLERESTARARGARIHAELAGHGDWWTPPEAGHAPPGSPEGVTRSIEAAMDMAGIGPGDIDAVVAHGESRLDLDTLEAEALAAVLGPRVSEVPVVTLGPHIGECDGGHGALSAVLALEMMGAGRVPAVLNREDPIDAWKGPRDVAGRDGHLRHVLVQMATREGVQTALVLRNLHG